MFELRQIAGYQVLSAREDITLHSDISELLPLVESALRDGKRSIAVRFTRNSYLLSRSMAVLIRCIEAIVEQGGIFAILDPNEQILDFLAIVDQNRRIRYFSGEEELAASCEENIHRERDYRAQIGDDT